MISKTLLLLTLLALACTAPAAPSLKPSTKAKAKPSAKVSLRGSSKGKARASSRASLQKKASVRADDDSEGMSMDMDTSHKIPKKLDYKLTYVANQPVEVYIGGKRVSSQFNAPQKTTVHLKGAPCKDLFFKLTHSVSNKPVAVAAMVHYKMQKYATRQIVKVEKPNKSRFSTDPNDFNYIPIIDPAAADAIPLYATAQKNPNRVFADEMYNSTGWPFARTVHSVLDNPVLPFLKIENEGADPISWNDGPSESGVYGLRVLLPFCYNASVTLSM